MKFKLAFTVAILVAVGYAITSYRLDPEFNAFIAEFNLVTDRMADELDGDLTSAGVARAQKILDAKKGDLKERLAKLKTVPTSQVSAETLTRFQEAIQANRAQIREIFIDESTMEKAINEDPKFLGNVVKLVEDYMSLIE
jgi:hypothetical protein